MLQQTHIFPKSITWKINLGEKIMKIETCVINKDLVKTVKQALDEGCELCRVIYPNDPTYEYVTVINSQSKMEVSFFIDRSIPEEDKLDAIYNSLVVI